MGDIEVWGISKIKSSEIDLVFPNDSEVMQLIYWVGKSPRMHLPTERLVMQGAHNYGSTKHPFLRALKSGFTALEDYYRQHSPQNICQMYRVCGKDEKGAELPPWELPWLLRKRIAPPGEKGLHESHGVSYYGPCTSQKVKLECSRLEKTVQSIKKFGYQPDKHGDVVGHFLWHNGDYRFFVRGGKHRAAVLAHLGNDTVPVRFRDDWPRVIDSADVSKWPLVASGEISQKLALSIFKRYFHEHDIG